MIRNYITEITFINKIPIICYLCSIVHKELKIETERISGI